MNRAFSGVIAAVTLAFLICFALSCNGKRSDANSESQITTAPLATSEITANPTAESTIPPTAVPTRIPTQAPTAIPVTPVPSLEPFEPVKVFEDSKVIIWFKQITSRGLVFTVDNLTNVGITIQADSVSVNGVSTNRITMSDDVAPQSIGEVVARINDRDILNIEEINSLSGQLRVIDFSKSFDSYDALYEVKLNEKQGYYEADYALTLLYTDELVDLYFWSVDSEGVHFLARNKTSINLTVQADSVSVNRRSINSIIMSDDIAPHSVSIICARCSVELEGEVETIGGQLRIIDFNRSFSSYNAAFVNVPIE